MLKTIVAMFTAKGAREKCCKDNERLTCSVVAEAAEQVCCLGTLIGGCECTNCQASPFGNSRFIMLGPRNNDTRCQTTRKSTFSPAHRFLYSNNNILSDVQGVAASFPRRHGQDLKVVEEF